MQIHAHRPNFLHLLKLNSYLRRRPFDVYKPFSESMGRVYHLYFGLVRVSAAEFVERMGATAPADPMVMDYFVRVREFGSRRILVSFGFPRRPGIKNRAGRVVRK